MATIYEDNRERELEYIHNESAGTLTLVTDREPDSTVPPTEWITVSTDDTVDLSTFR